MDYWNGNHRIALVTGASRGIGAGIVRALVKKGMTVIGCARNVEEIKNISKELITSPGQLNAMRCDLTNESEILSMFEEIRRKYGRLYVCINNAGLADDEPLLTGSTSSWKNMLDVNVLALSICTREAIKLMEECGVDEGHVIHLCSFGGHQINSKAPYLGLNFYCATKFMVRALTEGLRRELKEKKSKIRVSSISPGAVETEFASNFLKKHASRNSDEVYKRIECLQAGDIADAVVYILGSPSRVELHDLIVKSRSQPV